MKHHYLAGPDRKSRYRQGNFVVKNKEKYIGNTENVVYRSWLEFRAMAKLDSDPTITHWASEEISIPYISPIDGIAHFYFVDLFFEQKANGKTNKYICEVKPWAQTQKPTSKGKKLIMESAILATNLAKWKSATDWAKKRGAKFVIWTEKELGDTRKK